VRTAQISKNQVNNGGMLAASAANVTGHDHRNGPRTASTVTT
jgi:hypothetical protein